MKEKEFKEEDIDITKVNKKMAYYCKLCKCWHYPGSINYAKHKRYASRRPPRRRLIRRSSLRKFFRR